jgi:hypothetical protein
MDRWVADSFTAYLASFLGSFPEVNSAPITNSEICFRLLGGYPRKAVRERTIQRYEILKNILPFPKDELRLDKVIKLKYHRELSQFWDHIEGLSIDLSNLTDPEERDQRREITVRKLKQEIDDVAGRMRETWHEVLFLDVLPIVSAGGPLSLPTAIYQSIERRRNRQLLHNYPIAYGALLKHEWPSLRRPPK